MSAIDHDVLALVRARAEAGDFETAAAVAGGEAERLLAAEDAESLERLAAELDRLASGREDGAVLGGVAERAHGYAERARWAARRETPEPAAVSSAMPVDAPAPPPPLARRGTNGFAVASLVLGLLWLYGVGSILALVFGYRARREIDAGGGAQGGRGLATAGVVLGWIGVALLALVVLVVILLVLGGGE